MPLRKPEDDTTHPTVPETVAGKKFPPEAYNYDSDVSAPVVGRVQALADKILAQEEWVVIDGVDK